MREMKDSGLGYLGEIPVHWNAERIKNHLRFSPDKNPGEAIILSLYREHGIVPKDSRDDNHNVTSEDTSNYRYVREGDFVVNKMKAWQGSMGVSDYEGVVSPAYYVYRFTTDAFDKKYLHYLLRSKCYADEFRRLSGGIRIGQWDLPKAGFETTYVAVPPKDEQTAIADTIDICLEKVDTLITNVQAQIEKLKAYKQSVITEVVTKGLDPTAPMKDSGVEWIGEIPEHWSIERGKHLFAESDLRSADGSEELLTVSQYTGITPRSQKNVNMFEALSLEGYKICEVGDIAANTMWMWAGAIGVSQYYGVISPSYNVYRQIGTAYHSKYLDYLLRIPPLVQCYESQSTGIRASRLRLYPQQFLNIRFPVPPFEEQEAIVVELDGRCEKVEQLIALKQSKIEKLEQYKKSLIYEYVTGKKEVS